MQTTQTVTNRFYHSSESVIEKPTFDEWAKHTIREFFDEQVVGLFANTSDNVKYPYGENLHSFELKTDAKIFKSNETTYCKQRNDAGYRAALFEILRILKYDAILWNLENNEKSLVVLNFDKIKNWKRCKYDQ